MLDAWLTRRALGRRADRSAAAAHRAACAARRHSRQSLRNAARWCAGLPGLGTLFGVGLAGGLITAKHSNEPAPRPHAQAEAGAAMAPARPADNPSVTRDLAVNTLSRLAAAVIAAHLSVSASRRDETADQTTDMHRS